MKIWLTLIRSEKEQLKLNKKYSFLKSNLRKRAWIIIEALRKDFPLIFLKNKRWKEDNNKL